MRENLTSSAYGEGLETGRDVRSAPRQSLTRRKQEFFEQRAAAAQIARNESIGARDTVRRHPELTGTYLNLHAAELASRGLRDPEDQRRFVAQVRGALADDVECGEPLQPVRLRDRPLRSRTSELNENPQLSR